MGEKRPTITVTGRDSFSLEREMSRQIQHNFQNILLDYIKPDSVYGCSIPGRLITIGKRKMYHLYTTYNKNIGFSEADSLFWNLGQMWSILNLNNYDKVAYNKLRLTQ